MSMQSDRGLQILRLVYKGRYTSISMDRELWLLLVFLSGGDVEAKRWAADQVRLIDALSATGAGLDVRGAGLSRLVQRRIYEWIGTRLAESGGISSK